MNKTGIVTLVWILTSVFLGIAFVCAIRCSDTTSAILLVLALIVITYVFHTWMQQLNDSEHMRVNYSTDGGKTTYVLDCKMVPVTPSTPTPYPTPNTPSPSTPSPNTPSPSKPPNTPRSIPDSTKLSPGQAVDSQPSLPGALPNPVTKDGWIQASASCFGHYDWVNNDVRGCQYPIGTKPFLPGQISGCKAAGGNPQNGGYTDTTCVGNKTSNQITKSDLLTGHTAAFNNKYWNQNNYQSECGRCVLVKCDPTRLTFGTGQTCDINSKPLKLKVVDKMMETSLGQNEDYLRSIDINDQAFIKLTKGT